MTSQKHHAGTRQFGTHRATIGRDAEVDWVVLGLGGTRAKSRIESYLADQGANAKVTGAYFLTGEEHADYDTTQEHAAPNTTSDLFFKGVLADHARAVWRGVIRVDKGAQKTDAYQENRNLLLSHDAHADSIPGLEIEANDVRCTHGATIGQIDRLQLFYLMSRGLSREQAERLIVRGFFQPVLDRIGSDEVRESLAAELEARMGGSRTPASDPAVSDPHAPLLALLEPELAQLRPGGAEVIDVHTHLGVDEDGMTLDPAGLVAMLDAAGAAARVHVPAARP